MSDISTQHLNSDATEEYFNIEEMEMKYTGESSRGILIFSPIDPVHDVIFASVIFCVGLVLNALILRCYWSVKTSTAVYIRVLAWTAVCAMLYVASDRIIFHVFHPEAMFGAIFSVFANRLGVTSVLGPLFMALDRILIVAFPHSFKKHEKKMRIAKISIVVAQVETTVAYFIIYNTFGNSFFLTTVFKISSTLVFALQCIACVVLYAMIVIKVRASTRKIQPTSKCVDR